MATITKSVEVDVPCSTAYNQWTQFETFPAFMHDVESVTQLDNERNHWRTRIGGVEREFDTRIVQQEPDRVIAWESIEGPRQAGTIEFEPLDLNRTRVTARIEWAPQGITEKAGAALGMDDRAVEGDMERFKTFIENRDVETGAWRGEVNGGFTTPTPGSPLPGGDAL